MINLLENHPSVKEMITVREGVMTITSIILALIIGVLMKWDYSKLLENESIVSYFLIAGIIGALIYGYKPRFEKFFEKHEKFNKTNTIKEYSETLADKQKERDDYSNHLKDIFEVINSKKLPHYDAIRNSDEKKTIILQHFFTYERISRNAIYTRYQEARTIENRVKNAHSEINRLISEIMMETAGITSISGEHIMFAFKPFLKIFDFPETNKFMMLEKDFDIDVIDIDKIKFSNSLFRLENTDRKFYVKYDNMIIVETESKKTAKKCLELILKKGTSIIQLIQRLKEEKHTNEKLTKKVVNTIFEDMKILNDSGKPDLGVCDSCVEVFPFPTKDAHRKSLFDFNSILWHKAEEFWD